MRHFKVNDDGSAIKKILIGFINFYRAFPRNRPPVCRFTPSCSEYAYDSISIHGSLKGSFLSLRRLGRCHPWGGKGFDPVPSQITRTENSCLM
jgi:uncharacterized protein